jgi:hypothetical protein
MVCLVHGHRTERSNDRMALLLDLIRRAGALMQRRSALKHPLAWGWKTSTGIPASIAKLTEGAGTFEPPGKTDRVVASSKAIDVCRRLFRRYSAFNDPTNGGYRHPNWTPIHIGLWQTFVFRFGCNLLIFHRDELRCLLANKLILNG